MTHTAFVIKLGDSYCRFGSYAGCDLVDSPFRANLYSRLIDAERRLERRTHEHYWVSGERVPVGDFKIFEITVRQFTEAQIP